LTIAIDSGQRSQPAAMRQIKGTEFSSA
jgi:hypothetical protein